MNLSNQSHPVIYPALRPRVNSFVQSVDLCLLMRFLKDDCSMEIERGVLREDKYLIGFKKKVNPYLLGWKLLALRLNL